MFRRLSNRPHSDPFLCESGPDESRWCSGGSDKVLLVCSVQRAKGEGLWLQRLYVVAMDECTSEDCWMHCRVCRQELTGNNCS
jgi:hypothetical protein